jgi:SOS-response transcriptional repressor LexA
MSPTAYSGHEIPIGPHGFGVVVKGDSMTGRGIQDADVVWVDPDASYRLGDVVLALATSSAGVQGMVVKTYRGDCLVSETVVKVSERVCKADSFTVIGPAVGKTSSMQ